nr:hypothetical protein [Chryseobacterium sp. FH2]
MLISLFSVAGFKISCAFLSLRVSCNSLYVKSIPSHPYFCRAFCNWKKNSKLFAFCNTPALMVFYLRGTDSTFYYSYRVLSRNNEGPAIDNWDFISVISIKEK